MFNVKIVFKYSTSPPCILQVAKIIKSDEKKTPEISTHEMTPISPSTNCPLFLYNQPSFTPFLWSSPEHRFQNSFASCAIPDERENSNIDTYRTPLYILPCPWFFPFPNHGNGVHHPPSSLELKDKQDDAVNNKCSASPLIKNKPDIETKLANKCQEGSFGFSPDCHLKTPHHKRMIPANNLPNLSYGFSPDAHHILPHSNAMILSSSPLTSLKPAISLKHEGELKSSYIDNAEGSHMASVFSEKNQEPVICSSKRLVDAVAAAEARKRRKELTKLKNLHGRVRMHC